MIMHVNLPTEWWIRLVTGPITKLYHAADLSQIRWSCTFTIFASACEGTHTNSQYIERAAGIMPQVAGL